jgi:hypothetical protein
MSTWTPLGHRPKPVIAIQCLIAKAAHPATLQYATLLRLCCTQNLGYDRRFFMILNRYSEQ